jgi:hypothetical protein
MPTDIYWKKSQKKRSKIQRKCGKKKEKTSYCKEKKKSSRTEIRFIYSNIKKRRALYLSINRTTLHSWRGKLLLRWTWKRTNNTSPCTEIALHFRGENRKNKISILKYRHLQKSDGGDRISYRNNAFVAATSFCSFRTATDCFVPSVLLLLAVENKAAAEDSRRSSNDNTNVTTRYSRLSFWQRSSVVVKSKRDLTGS